MKNLRFVPLVMIATLSLQACSKPPAASTQISDQLQGKLVLTGSSTVAPLISEIAKRYEAEHSGVRIDVQTGGSSRGVADARQGVADIGMVSRSLKDNEKEPIPLTWGTRCSNRRG